MAIPAGYTKIIHTETFAADGESVDIDLRPYHEGRFMLYVTGGLGGGVVSVTTGITGALVPVRLQGDAVNDQNFTLGLSLTGAVHFENHCDKARLVMTGSTTPTVTAALFAKLNGKFDLLQDWKEPA